MSTAQIVTLILGILGGLAGIGGSLTMLGLGGLGGALGVAGAGAIIWRSIGGVLLTILGIVGAGIVGRNPKLSGLLMLFAAFGGLILVAFTYIPATILFLAGGILAFLSKKKPKAESSSSSE